MKLGLEVGERKVQAGKGAKRTMVPRIDGESIEGLLSLVQGWGRDKEERREGAAQKNTIGRLVCATQNHTKTIGYLMFIFRL